MNGGCFFLVCCALFKKQHMLPAYLTSDDALGRLPQVAQLWPLTRYEMTMVVSNRAQALAQGATPNIACPPDHDAIDTALQELQCGALPPTRVMRILPDETAVAVPVSAVFRVSKRNKAPAPVAMV